MQCAVMHLFVFLWGHTFGLFCYMATRFYRFQQFMDYNKIIEKYYTPGSDLYNILLRHSRDVTRRALRIVDTHPELGADRRFVEEAAMLHDIGIVRCDAPGICCHGTEPYLRHGMIGAEMMRGEGLERHARVCERHTGAGLSAREIEEQNLPLPHRDFLPETIEEQIVCYADKFYSKSHLDREKTLPQAEKTIARFGEEGLQRFLKWERMFE